jgi:uncharacterized membrane protein YfcA
MMAISAATGAACGVVGLIIAYHLNVSSGSLIVCLTTLVFLLVLVFEPRRGALARFLRRGAYQEPASAAEPVSTIAPHGH